MSRWRTLEPVAFGLAHLGAALGVLAIPWLWIVFALVLPHAVTEGAPASEPTWLQGAGTLQSLTKVTLVLLHTLVFWHVAHRLRALATDLGVRPATLAAVVCYGGALAGGLWAATRLFA